ncbi:MAG: class I SAM-dependent methyltransferase [Anaerolineales bacterium]|nr:class I SAM-dependent methyltransferase [Anaerolineales bacterium]
MRQPPPSLSTLLARAFAARQPLLDERHQTAVRLFNGFREGWPALAVDLFAGTAVIHNFAERPMEGAPAVRAAEEILCERLPWVHTIIVKVRNGDQGDRCGRIVYGSRPDHKIREHGVWYALDLLLHQDTSLYLDTRNLRRWAIDNLAGMTVLNTFAYTGSLGVAAIAGGARRVVQVDLNRTYLNLAKTSYNLNGFPLIKGDFQTGDFWPHVNRLKRAGEIFDCVFLDPPFFAATSGGTIDLTANSARLINKLRPLVTHDGWLVAVNNALFLSGRDYLSTLEDLGAGGHLQVERLIPVPEDFAGYPETRAGEPPADPAPFNHPTKIALLRVRHKAGNRPEPV